ncbi:MAG: hypothetical protein ACM3N3_12245, partial [Betaproteobacteria bacterium]
VGQDRSHRCCGIGPLRRSGASGCAPFPDEITLELRALIARRRQITEMIVAENTGSTKPSRAVKKRIDAHIRWLEAELARADKDLDQSIRHSPIWCISQHII